jgi:thymidylate synthase ThyX
MTNTNISVNLIKHSVSEQGKHIYTFECIYPRFVHSEVMTHRVFSRNASSSRAIPINKLAHEAIKNPVEFTYWGKNKKGMSAKEELSGIRLSLAKLVWRATAKLCGYSALLLSYLGLHKQNANRMLEPFTRIKLLITTTELNNFFVLRDHEAAQPEIRVLAQEMKKAIAKSTPQLLKKGEWHLPYVDSKSVDLRETSAALCAQVSFRALDDNEDKLKRIYKALILDRPVHASPTEHQATPLDNPEARDANFVGWAQHRSVIEYNVILG